MIIDFLYVTGGIWKIVGWLNKDAAIPTSYDLKTVESNSCFQAAELETTGIT